MMQETNRAFVSDAGMRGQFAVLFNELAATLAAMPTSMTEIHAPLLGVEASYLQAGLDEVTAEYGSMDNYLKQGLGLSQETLYVLRRKMVRYGTLPGEAGLLGNAAAGAQLLRQLQDSSLSGSYSAYNYYLQSPSMPTPWAVWKRPWVARCMRTPPATCCARVP